MDGAGLSGGGRRAIAALALALVGCGTAAADHTPVPAPAVTVPADILGRLGVTRPADWVRMPAVETAAATAAATITSATTGVEAWGDPGAGCYAVVIESRGLVRESIVGSANRFAAALAPLGVDPKAVPAPVNDVLDVALPIKSGELTGTLALRMFRSADRFPQGIALACGANAREPARCAMLCQAMIAQLAPPGAAP